MGSLLVSTVVLLLGIASGYCAGRWLGLDSCCITVGLASVSSSLLALVALFRPFRENNPRGIERIISGLLLAYLFFLTVTEQFAWSGHVVGVMIGIALLIPVAVGNFFMVRENCWLVGSAFWFSLFASVAALCYSVMHEGSGVGLFLMCWLA